MVVVTTVLGSAGTWTTTGAGVMIRVVLGGGLEWPQPLLRSVPVRPATRAMRFDSLVFIVRAFGSRL